MVIFDATFLLLLVDPEATPPLEPGTKKPVSQARERIEYLISELQKSGERIGVPTPALAEALVASEGSTADLMGEIASGYKLKTIAFDELAAIEVAMMPGKISSKKGKPSDATKARVKYDNQIIAIAKVAGADTIYSDDKGLAKKAHNLDIRTISVDQLPLPPVDPQKELTFDELRNEEDDGEN